MADAQQVDDISFRIEGIDNPIISHAQPTAVVPLQPGGGGEKFLSRKPISSTLASMRAWISGGSFRKAASNVV